MTITLVKGGNGDSLVSLIDRQITSMEAYDKWYNMIKYNMNCHNYTDKYITSVHINLIGLRHCNFCFWRTWLDMSS